MFTSLQPELRIPFMITSMIIAVPTGIKVFGWLGTLWQGKIHFTSAMLFGLGFLSMFVIGGISGVMLASVPFDIHVHDTYFVVSHLHFVLFGGSVFTIYAGIYHWYPKITGRMLNERLGRIHFALTYVSFFFTFFPMHMAGMLGMPRRVAEYDPAFQSWNIVISLAGFVLGLSTFVLLYNMVVSVTRGAVAGPNPWRALSLEWQTSSPPPAYNFRGEPIPFEDPYGYGTEAATAYLELMDQRLAAHQSGRKLAAPSENAPQIAGD
jgi:cytochrome c oxidase subunit 1